jgi:hypothetical protein
LGAVSWWKLDGNASDVFGLNNGVISGTVDCTVNGYYGKACNFHNVSGEKISVNPLPASLQITGEMTVEAWVYPTALPTGLGRVVLTTYKWNSPPIPETGWTLGNGFGSTDYFYFAIYNNSNGASASGYDFFSQNMNKWTQVVGVFKPSQYVRLYVNGNLKTENHGNIPAFIYYDPTMPLKMGLRADTDTQGMWNGTIDEVIIFNRSLTDPQIKALYTMDLTKS